MKQWITHNEKSASKHTVGGLEKNQTNTDFQTEKTEKFYSKYPEILYLSTYLLLWENG